MKKTEVEKTLNQNINEQLQSQVQCRGIVYYPLLNLNIILKKEILINWK